VQTEAKDGACHAQHPKLPAFAENMSVALLCVAVIEDPFMATRNKAKATDIKKVDEAAGIVEYRLKNGLKVLLRENHAAPVVSFMVVYRVGSRNESVGHTGATHFLEHMMFKGTPRFNPAKGCGVFEIFSRIGALLNATTWLDRTNYFECVPREYLELCISIEADRMRNLNLRQQDRDSEMTVVRNEFERGENNPGSALSKEVVALAFREHPYHHPTIGWRSDVEGVPLSRLKEFYNTFYWPDNATAIVVGDFEPEATLALINKYFGRINASPGSIPPVYTVEPPQEGERRVELLRAGDLPQLLIAYHTPCAGHEDTYPLAVMQALLGDSGKRSSRLYKALLEKGLATSCYASNGEFRDPFLFTLGATLSPGRTFAEVEAAICAEISRLAQEPAASDELQRARSANRKGTILGSADPQTFANMICGAESVADWRWLVEYDDRYDAVQPEDVMRVASRYFEPTNRTVGHFIPTERKALPAPCLETSAIRAPARPDRASKSAVVSEKRMELARPGATPSDFAARVIRRVLDNGLTVLVLPVPGTGSVAVHGAVAAGECFGLDRPSFVAPLSSTMLSRGSSAYAKEAFAKIFEEMGIRFGVGTDRFKAAFGTLITRQDFAQFIAVLAELLRRPVFPEEELQLVGNETRAALTRALNDTGRRAGNALMQSLYPPDHVFYEKGYEERLQELDYLSPDLLRSFHQEHFTPAGSILTVVGDIEAERAFDLVSEHFADWSGAPRKAILLDDISLPAAPELLRINLDDKANADIIIGHPCSLRRDSREFFAAQLANAALGKDTISSRLGKVLRVEHGLTYGIHSYFEDTTFGAGPWLVGFSVNPGNVSKALKLAREVMRDYLKKGISARELEDEAGRAVGSFLVALRSPEGIAAALTRFEYIGLGVAAMDTLVNDFMSVKRKDVQAALHKYMHPDRAVTVVAGTLSRVV
jgi:zinc protease